MTATTREIWNGKGDADGKVYFVTKSGRIIGRPELRRMARRTWSNDFLADTIDDDAWLAPLHGMLPAAVVRSCGTR